MNKMNKITNLEQDSWLSELESREDLNRFGSNAVGLFALALRFDIDDLEGVGVSSIVDGGGDKKNDLIFIDEEIGVAVVIQAYFTEATKPSAPANKASDLNTAIAWLLSIPSDYLPKGIKSHAIRLRDGIKGGAIKKLYVWYVHNCPESLNVEEELKAVRHALKHAIDANFPKNELASFVKQVGGNTLAEWYGETQSPIVVNEVFNLPCENGFEIATENWAAFVTALTAGDLFDIYKKHSIKLFSANIRDYLGARISQSNINNGITTTISNAPSNFWVFNNGLTILSHKVSFDKDRNEITIHGMSIVNGAQTTGAIGSISKRPSSAAKVPVRFVSVKDGDKDLIHDIVRYNNSQNQVTAADFRSTDMFQRRLRQEVAKIKDAEYEGGRRGGFGSAIKRKPKLMPSFTVGQALAAFHGHASVAYNKKSEIWSNDSLYSEFFNDKTTGAHLVFVYSLLKAVEDTKSHLFEKSKNPNSLTALDKQKIEFFRTPAAVFVYINAISRALETIIERPISDYFSLSFGGQTSPSMAKRNWSTIVNATSPFTRMIYNSISGGLSKSSIDEGIQGFMQQVEVSAANQGLTFSRFAKHMRNPSSLR